MSLLLIGWACALMALPLHRLLARSLPRRFAGLRPSIGWLTAGLVSLSFASLWGLIAPTIGGESAPVARAALMILGATAIVFFCHRRVYFGRRGVYESRWGGPIRFVPYRGVHGVGLGHDLAREGLYLNSRGEAVYAVSALLPRRQLAEALAQLSKSGIALPAEDELRARIGLDYASLKEAIARSRRAI